MPGLGVTPFRCANANSRTTRARHVTTPGTRIYVCAGARWLLRAKRGQKQTCPVEASHHFGARTPTPSRLEQSTKPGTRIHVCVCCNSVDVHRLKRFAQTLSRSQREQTPSHARCTPLLRSASKTQPNALRRDSVLQHATQTGAPSRERRG